MSPPPRPRKLQGWPLFGALLFTALAGVGDEALAHAGPVQVIENRFVVTAALSPAGDATRLQFFFRDFRSGREPAEALAFRVRVLEDRSQAMVCESSAAAVRDGRAEVLCRFPREGAYEVFLQFWLDQEPARVYQPEDWQVWIGRTGRFGNWITTAVLGMAAVTIGVIGVFTWRHRGDGKDGV